MTVTAALASVLLCVPVASAQAPLANSFRITNVRVFDGESVQENTQVAIENGTVRAVGAEAARWRSLPAIDGTGATLLPGLIDAHAHVRTADELRQAMRFGVTTVFDLGAVIEPEALFALRSESRSDASMADLRVGGVLATARSPQEPGALTVGSTPQIRTVEDARAFAASRAAEGVDHLKIILRGQQSSARGVPNLDEPRVRALADGAHAANLFALVHIETLGDARIAVAGGVDGFVHLWRSEGAVPEFAREVAARGAFAIPTLDGGDAFLEESRVALLSDARLAPLLSANIRQQLAADRSFSLIPAASAPIEERRAAVAAQIAAARSLHEAGVRLIAGSDASTNAVAFGITFHRELELLTAAGLSPSEALAAATSVTADVFRMPDRGRIVPGRRADLLLVRGDPTVDILATRSVLKVWKAGVEAPRQ